MEDTNHIEIFLKKFKNLISPHDSIKKATIDSIKKATGINIDKKNISFKNGIVYIKTQHHEKSYIFLNKKNILNNIKNILKEKTPNDIK